MSASILVVGEATVDVTVQSDRLPGRLPEREELLPLPEYGLAPGGAGLATAVALATVGVNVTLITRVGRDVGGRLVRDLLREREMDAGRVVEDPSRSTCFSLIRRFDEGEIGLLHHEGASAALSRADIPGEAIEACRILHVAGALQLPQLDGEPLAALLEEARALDKSTAVGLSRHTARAALLEPVFPHIDRLFLNRKEALEITGCGDVPAAAAALRERGARQVIVTLGSEGCYIASSKFTGEVSTKPVQAVDTTGCGDAFAAGYLYGVACRLPVETCAMWANVLGARCAGTRGAIVSPL